MMYKPPVILQVVFLLLQHMKRTWIKYALIFFGSLTGFVIFFYLFVAYVLPLPQKISDPNVPATKILDRNGVILYEILRPDTGKVTYVSLENIPQHLINATLSAEDINFYKHSGVDYPAIARAVFYNVKEQRVVSGASTITQQLIRNLMGTTSRSLSNKLLEAMYAVRISNVYDKDEILEQYLNKIYYGNLAYGVESAALDYFNKHVRDLDLAQSSFLAGLPQSPSRYNPYVNFNQAKKRQKYVLDRMVVHGFVSEEVALEAYDEPLKLAPNKSSIKAPHFVHYVINQIVEDFGEDALFYGGLTVTTSLDYSIQLEAENAIKRQISRLKEHNVNNAALLSLDTSNGQILAWVGSAGYFDVSINGAVDMVTALRQPGSAIKPFNYLMAFEKGYSPATVIFDIPTQFNSKEGPYTPKNYDLDYHGPVRVRTALASSYNIPAVKTLEYGGVNNFISFLGKMGINSLSGSAEFYGLALTLGGGEVRLLDMAEGFNVIANYGDKFDLSAIIKVEDFHGRVLKSFRTPSRNFVLGKNGREHSYQIIDILKDPNARIPGFGEGSILELTHEAAVKTGTTRNFRDNWTIGFTPGLLTGVWVGNADATMMKNVSGVDGAAPIWANFMEAALAGKPRKSFIVPGGLREVELCSLSGLLPTAFCPERIFELLTPEQIPAKEDDYYREYVVNTQTGKVIHSECANQYPASSLSRKTVLAYPAELQKWAAGKGIPVPVFEHCGLSNNTQNGYSNEYPGGQPAVVFIDSPADKDEFLIDYTLPAHAQKIPFRVRVPVGTTKVEFFVDEVIVGSTDIMPFTYLWDSKPGQHKISIKAFLADGPFISSPFHTFKVNH
jgi:penicillin-binding protein 1C